MRETTILTLESRGGLRQRLARLRPRAMDSARTAAIRLARGVELVTVVTGWALVPVLPLLAAAIARDRQYLRSYPASVVQVTRHIRATWRGRALSRMLVRRLAPAALHAPQRIVGSCTHCGNCCLYRSCVFLRIDARGQSSCRIYGGHLWKGLTCGEYPVDADEIELYSCPSFTALADPAGPTHRVIPLVPAPSSSRGDARR